MGACTTSIFGVVTKIPSCVKAAPTRPSKERSPGKIYQYCDKVEMKIKDTYEEKKQVLEVPGPLELQM